MYFLGGKLATYEVKEQHFFFLECELLWVSGHYACPNEEIFVNVLYVKYNLLPLPPLGFFSRPSLKPVIFSHPNCLSFCLLIIRSVQPVFGEISLAGGIRSTLCCLWHLTESFVQSTHANEVIPLRPLREM